MDGEHVEYGAMFNRKLSGFWESAKSKAGGADGEKKASLVNRTDGFPGARKHANRAKKGIHVIDR